MIKSVREYLIEGNLYRLTSTGYKLCFPVKDVVHPKENIFMFLSYHSSNHKGDRFKFLHKTKLIKFRICPTFYNPDNPHDKFNRMETLRLHLNDLIIPAK